MPSYTVGYPCITYLLQIVPWADPTIGLPFSPVWEKNKCKQSTETWSCPTQNLDATMATNILMWDCLKLRDQKSTNFDGVWSLSIIFHPFFNVQCFALQLSRCPNASREGRHRQSAELPATGSTSISVGIRKGSNGELITHDRVSFACSCH